MNEHDEERLFKWLERLFEWEQQNNTLLREILGIDKQILAVVSAPVSDHDIGSFGVTVDKPISQGDTPMAKVGSFRATITQTMLDDQKALAHFQPLDTATPPAPTSLPTGGVPTFSASDATVTLVAPAPDPTTGIVDPLAIWMTGVKGTAGTPTVTCSFTNADGTVATGGVALTITRDPAELDVGSFGVTVDPPVAQ